MKKALKICAFLVALTTIVCAIFAIGGVLVFCGGHALAPDAFFADGQCSASDTPFEVFMSFAAIGAILGCCLALVAGVYRVFLTLFERRQA